MALVVDVARIKIITFRAEQQLHEPSFFLCERAWYTVPAIIVCCSAWRAGRADRRSRNNNRWRVCWRAGGDHRGRRWTGLTGKKKFGPGQCCVSGVRCRFDPWIQDPEWVKNQDPGSGINNTYPYFREIRKYLNSLVRIMYPGWQIFGSGMQKFGSGIRDKHPGSATLGLTKKKYSVLGSGLDSSSILPWLGGGGPYK